MSSRPTDDDWEPGEPFTPSPTDPIIHGPRWLALLRDVADSGVEFDDSRIGWVTVQIDRDTWNEIKELPR